MPDTVIAGRYRLVNLLGRGGMSEVYAAEDLELGRQVALKLLAPDADGARFEREARAVASLAHPNVMQLYDYGEDAGRPYMVLEYVPGGTLEDRLADARGAPLTDDETQAVAAGVAAGLAHAHGRGVVHRDLKPANVLFDAEGRPKLADFGIARVAAGGGTLTEAGTVLGTAAYISPEQAAGATATAASDVYSFGVILYRMLTGRLPFESSDPLELVMMHRDATPPPVTRFRADPPGTLETVATAALAKDPAARPSDGGALLAALGVAGGTALTAAASALGADETQVLPAGRTAGAATAVTRVAPGAGAAPPAPAPEPPARSRAPLLAAALLVLLLAGGALAYELTRPAGSARTPGTLPSLTTPTRSTASTTQQTTTAASTTEPTTTQQTTTAPPTTTAAPPTTTAPPPTTTTPPPTTTAPPTTAPAPPTTTASILPPTITLTTP